MKNEEPYSYYTGRSLKLMTPAEIDEEVKALGAAMHLIAVCCALVIPLIIALGLLLYFLKP